jgi:hypothetical protein
MPQRISTAERIAISLSKLLTDFHVDLDTIGYYIYRTMPPLLYNRFQDIAHAAEHERQMHQNKEYREAMQKIGL